MLEPNSSLRQLGRFSEPGLLILVSLADGPKHGYAILEAIQQLAGVRLGPARCMAPWRGSNGWA